jgi:hypothetical protein
MRAVLIHGMGRTPLGMALLAYRLQKAGIKTELFWYCVTLESFKSCANRLQTLLETRVSHADYVIVAHSLGSVLSRYVVNLQSHKPSALFLLAPPTVACQMAQRLRDNVLYRLLTGEMGQLLADRQFMASLPPPRIPTHIYSGNVGFRGRFSPFGEEPNDGILAVSETQLVGSLSQVVPSTHTFIMNNASVAKDIIAKAKQLCV